MIFDCLDGVVARAKKLGSPMGRTIDEMGDMVGYIGMQIGTLVHIHRHYPDESLVFMLAAGMLVPGWMAMTYDYYKRTFTSFLKGTNDGPAEELVRRDRRPLRPHVRVAPGHAAHAVRAPPARRAHPQRDGRAWRRGDRSRARGRRARGA
jgi:hypothetical protein